MGKIERKTYSNLELYKELYTISKEVDYCEIETALTMVYQNMLAEQSNTCGNASVKKALAYFNKNIKSNKYGGIKQCGEYVDVVTDTVLLHFKWSLPVKEVCHKDNIDIHAEISLASHTKEVVHLISLRWFRVQSALEDAGINEALQVLGSCFSVKDVLNTLYCLGGLPLEESYIGVDGDLILKSSLGEAKISRIERE